MTRYLTAVPVALLLLLTGCSSSDDNDDNGDKSAKAGSETTTSSSEGRVEVGGVSFELPEDWTTLDAQEMADDVGETDEMKEVQGALGMSDAQFDQLMDSVDLYAVTGEGAKNGFLDNVVAVVVPGSMPSDTQIESEILALEGKVQSLEREETDAGEVARMAYTMPAGAGEVQGEALSVEVDGSVVSISVSTPDAATSAEVADLIMETISEA